MQPVLARRPVRHQEVAAGPAEPGFRLRAIRVREAARTTGNDTEATGRIGVAHRRIALRQQIVIAIAVEVAADHNGLGHGPVQRGPAARPGLPRLRRGWIAVQRRGQDHRVDLVRARSLEEQVVIVVAIVVPGRDAMTSGRPLKPHVLVRYTLLDRVDCRCGVISEQQERFARRLALQQQVLRVDTTRAHMTRGAFAGAETAKHRPIARGGPVDPEMIRRPALVKHGRVTARVTQHDPAAAPGIPGDDQQIVSTVGIEVAGGQGMRGGTPVAAGRGGSGKAGKKEP